MTKSKSLEYELRYIQAGLEVLEKYLLSDEVFWPIGVTPPDGEPDYPRLTLDGILLARKRAESHMLSANEKEMLERTVSDLDFKRSRWRVAWEAKAGQCYRVRIRMWGDVIQEYQENPQENADRYAYEVRLRVMLTLLTSELGRQEPAEIGLLTGLDKYLRSVLIPGNFIWDEELQVGFSSQEYWYLYGHLPPSGWNSGYK